MLRLDDSRSPAIGAPAPAPAPWKGLLRWGLGVLLLAAVGVQLFSQWGQLQATRLTFNPAWSLAALIGLTTFFALSAEGWRRLLQGLGATLAYRDCFRIIFYSNLGKYLPGGVWNMVGRVALAQRQGVPALVGTASLLLEVACQLAAALLIAFATMPFWSGHGLQADGRVLALLAVAVPLAMHPRLLNWVLGLGEKVLKRPFPRLPVSYAFVLGMLAFYTLNWLLLCLGFAALAQALTPTPLTLAQSGLLVGAFPIAWNVAVFAFVFPAGLGVREVALAALLGSAFPPAWPAMLALVARIWVVLGEIAAFGIASLLKVPAVAADPTTREV